MYVRRMYIVKADHEENVYRTLVTGVIFTQAYVVTEIGRLSAMYVCMCVHFVCVSTLKQKPLDVSFITKLGRWIVLDKSCSPNFEVERLNVTGSTGAKEYCKIHLMSVGVSLHSGWPAALGLLPFLAALH